MSDLSKAVFLSYASQDADAARRICEALRTAGVEVWFDQSELVGGDAWDQKIRKQIKDCALLIPIISAATQARTEGYFRLEWRLADQRTHLMAKGRPFLLPVVIDDTRDADAQVPDSFTEVQWTRLRQGSGGQATDDARVAAFCVRVKRLLSGDAPVGAGLPRDGLTESSQPKSRGKPAPTRKAWMAAGILVVITVAVLAIWGPWRTGEPLSKLAAADVPTSTSQIAKTASTQPVEISEARKLIAKAWEQLNKTGLARAELEMAERLCEQAAELDPNDAEIWAAWSQLDTWYYYTNLERTPARREGASSKAARALRIAPDSYEARLAQACFLVREAPHEKSIFADEAERQLRQLLQERVDEPRALFALGILLRNGLRYDDGALVFDRLARQPAFAATALSEKGFLRLFQGRFQEAGECADQSIALEPFYGNLALKTFVAVDWYGDLEQAREAVEMMPAAALMEDYGAGAACDVYWRRREPDKMLRILRALPREWLSSNNLSGPKQFYVGVAHQMAGRLDAAHTEWRTALEMLNLRLQSDPNTSEWHFLKAKLLVRLGENKTDAEVHFRLAQDFATDAWQRFHVAIARTMLSGDVDGAIQVIEQSMKAAEHWGMAAALKTNPEFDPIRADPRFQALVARAEADPRLSPNGRPSAPANRTQVDAKSVAVLAFANLSDDKDNEYFSDGISEELLNVLAKIPGLKVTARTSAFHFKGKDTPIPEIARQLGVAYVVEGSVRKSGDRVRISAQLIKAADGFHVWSDTFTRELKDIFAVQDEIAGLVAQRLQLKLGVGAPAAALDSNALQLYLEARALWNVASVEALARMESLLERVLAAEPQFAPAEAGLAFVGVTRSLSAAQAVRHIPEEIGQAEMHAKRALEIDPNSAEALEVLGTVAWLRGRLEESESQLRRAVSNNPNYARGWNRLGWLLERRGKLDEALECYLRARELDPLASPMLDGLGRIRNQLGQPAETIALYERARIHSVLPPILRLNLATAYLIAGRNGDAVATARTVLEMQSGTYSESRTLVAIQGVAAWILSEGGAHDQADAAIQRILAGSEPLRWVAGLPLLAEGRVDEACQLLSETPQHLVVLFWLVTARQPALAQNPRFLRLLDELGATEAFRLVNGRPEKPRVPREPTP